MKSSQHWSSMIFEYFHIQQLFDILIRIYNRIITIQRHTMISIVIKITQAQNQNCPNSDLKINHRTTHDTFATLTSNNIRLLSRIQIEIIQHQLSNTTPQPSEQSFEINHIRNVDLANFHACRSLPNPGRGSWWSEGVVEGVRWYQLSLGVVPV